MDVHFASSGPQLPVKPEIDEILPLLLLRAEGGRSLDSYKPAAAQHSFKPADARGAHHAPEVRWMRA
jgi:hypothetical protein